MKLPFESMLLRIFIAESRKRDGKPLYRVIVNQALEQGLAGATVLRGILGFGPSSRIHTSRVLRLSEDLPIIIEIVDTEEKIEAFIPILDEMIDDGLVTLEKAKVLAYRYRKDSEKND